MLILTRRKDESIVLGDGEYEVMVVEIRSGEVRLGVKADREKPIHRKEIYERIKRQGEPLDGR